MLSNSLKFFSRSLAILFVVVLCAPTTATAQSEVPQLIQLPIEQFVPNGFIVYGKAPTQEEAGIAANVHYRQTTDPLPNLEVFFEFGGTLELVTTTLFFTKHDIVISEIMWGLDESYPAEGDDTYTQWIELYNIHREASFTSRLFLLFTPFQNYPDRQIIELPNGQRGLVLDAISNLHLGRWDLPGRSGRRPFSNVVSAYRNITYTDDANLNPHRANVPFGSYAQSWKATPTRGRRNTLLHIVNDADRVIELPYIATPGSPHVSDPYLRPVFKTAVRSDRVIINEVRNDVSNDNLDWVELKNVSPLPIDLENWELSIVTGIGADTDLVNLPAYEMAPGEVLLLQARHPKFTILAGGINIENPKSPKTKGALHRYFVAPSLNFPNVGKFTLLLRSELDKNGEDAAIEDYAGNGFFPDTFSAVNTEFWPRAGQPRPTEVANFGNYSSFGSLNSSWARLRYWRDAGHHEDAWEVVGSQGGIGYVPGTDLSISPGTPGYENTALKTRVDDADPRTPIADNEYITGEITISEIMVDGGARDNKAQWIELYNSSLTQAVNLEGWALEICNLKDDNVSLVKGSFIFNDAVILPNQTLLIVSRDGPNNVKENRVYNLRQQHRGELRLGNRQYLLLNPSGFYLKLTSGNSQRNGNVVIVDEAGNLDVKPREPTKLWDLPARDPEVRRSLVRQYGGAFRPNQGRRNSEVELAAIGTFRESWWQADRTHVSFTYYGNASDIGTPAHRLGSPLPVQLSSFHPKRAETGVVLITWATESELNNAGFNILRSEKRDSEFKVINPTLIPGAGTTSEKHTYSFSDTTAKPNVVYYYQIEEVSLSDERQALATVRLKGQMSASEKLTTTWSKLKIQD